MVYAYIVEDKDQHIDTKRVDSSPRCPLATALTNNTGEYSYACAGEDISKEVFVEPGFTEEDKLILAFSQKMEKFADIVYGKVVAIVGDPREKPGLLGWSEATVKKGQFFWIRKVPMGAVLVPEGGTSADDKETDSL